MAVPSFFYMPPALKFCTSRSALIFGSRSSPYWSSLRFSSYLDCSVYLCRVYHHVHPTGPRIIYRTFVELFLCSAEVLKNTF